MKNRVNYNKVAPPDTFLSDWMEYNVKSETPFIYDFWTGLFTLSSAIGRCIYVDRPFAPVYLNIYCILVAESGITRKSSSVRRAVGFVRKLTGDNNMLIESKITPELIEFNLAMQSAEYGTANAVIAIDELVKFLGREKYIDTMPSLLTDLYDCPNLRVGGGSLSRGKTMLKDVFVNFLSASTPSWLLRAVNPDVIEGGFTSRVIFVVSEKPKSSNPWPEKPDEELHGRIESRLESIKREAQQLSRITISEGARRVFDAWYKRRERRRDAFRSSFQSREDGHILRLAALLAINDLTWEIQANHIKTAIKIIEEAREDGAAIFAGTGNNSKVVLGIDALRDKLLAGSLGGVPQGELTKHCQRYMNAAYVKDTLAIMHELGMVQQFQGVQVERGRPSTIWRATNKLVDSRALDKIIQMVEPA